jgi:aspartyl/asparaginyl beta-hydroxylase (cupin superfamily)
MYSSCSLDINVEWQTLKNTLQQAADEALGKRKKRKNKRCLILWNGDIKNLIENKKAYLQYLTTRSETDKIDYKRLVAIVKRETRKIKRQCWKTFVLRIGHDLHGCQINACKVIKNLNN